MRSGLLLGIASKSGYTRCWTLASHVSAVFSPKMTEPAATRDRLLRQSADEAIWHSRLQRHETAHGGIGDAVASGFNMACQTAQERGVPLDRDDEIVPAAKLAQ